MSSPSLSTSPISATAWSPTTTPSNSPPPPVAPDYTNQPGPSGRLSIDSIASSANGAPAITNLYQSRGLKARPNTVIYGPSQQVLHDIDQPTRLQKAGPDTLKCQSCSTDLAYTSQIVSKGFTGRHGRAFLLAPPPTVATKEFSTSRSHFTFPSVTESKTAPTHGKTATHFDTSPDLINVRIGKVQARQLVTGSHVVADISCIVCGVVVGWKYVDASERGQRYKIGKFILECKRVVRGTTWEELPIFPTSMMDDRSSIGDGSLTLGERSEDSTGLEISMNGLVTRKDLSKQLGPGTHRGVREGEVAIGKGCRDDEVLVFDSEDDSECEDIFAGVWDAEKVRIRRQKKAGKR